MGSSDFIDEWIDLWRKKLKGVYFEFFKTKTNNQPNWWVILYINKFSESLKSNIWKMENVHIENKGMSKKNTSKNYWRTIKNWTELKLWNKKDKSYDKNYSTQQWYTICRGTAHLTATITNTRRFYMSKDWISNFCFVLIILDCSEIRCFNWPTMKMSSQSLYW